MTREEVFTELRSAGYSGALEDMLIEAWSTTSIEDYLFYDLSSASGGLDNFIMGATDITDFGIGDTLWTTARTDYWTDARTDLWTDARNSEVTP